MRPFRHPVAVVFRKEVRDNLRDRRSLISALIYPLLGPLVFAVLLAFMGGVSGPGRGQAVKLSVAGANQAPALVSLLEAKGYRVVAAPPDVDKAVRAGRVPLVLRVSDGFEKALAAGGKGRLEVVTDNARLEVVMATSRLVDVLRGYAADETARRLARKGLSTDEIQPVSIDNLIVSKELKAGELLLLMIPAFVMFTLFIGGVYLAIDSIAGERERGSLEPLLANPVPRWTFLAGKALAAGLFTLMALTLQILAFLWVLAPYGHLFGDSVGFGPGKALASLPLLPPMLALAVAVQMLVAILTRSFKEAQTWLGLLPLVPAVPGMVLALMPVHAGGWAMAVPLLSQVVSMQQLIRGNPVSPLHDIVGGTVTLAVAAALFRIAARRLEREEAVVGGG